MDYKFIPPKDLHPSIKLGEYCFVTQPGCDRTKEMLHLLEQEVGLGGYENEELVTQLYVYPFEMNVFGITMPMGGIATVSTYPEYRTGGHTKRLLLKSLEVMREKGQLVSVLAPFSESFYRQYGWEVFFENTRYRIPVEQVQMRFREENEKVVRFDTTNEAWQKKVQAYYTKMVSKRNGLTYRDDYWWMRLNTREFDAFCAASLDADGEIDGYVRYRIENKEFKVLDFFTDHARAERILFQYIARHASQVGSVVGKAPVQSSFPVQMKHPEEVEREVFFDKMVRIVDVEAFFKVYPFEKITKSLYVKITDPSAPWNEHTFQIDSDGTVTKPKQVETDKVLEMEIGPFSAMMMGYHDINWYEWNGYAQALDKVKENWKQAIPVGYPSFHDDF